MCFSQNTHNGELFSSFDAHSTLQGHRASGDIGPAGDNWLSRNRFPRNETPRDPVRSGYKYPDAGNKYILETLYLRERVNDRR